MSCPGTITAGIAKNCALASAPIGSLKDLILVNFDEFDQAGTLAALNIEADDTNLNLDGLSTIKLLAGASQNVFEGSDYSVVPNVASEVKEDGDSWYMHSLAFIVYNKNSTARKTLIELAKARVIAIVIDRSTGFYELFGAEHGLKMSENTREYTGSQNSNYYSVSIATPDVAGVKEGNMGWLCHTEPVVAA